MCSFDYVKVLFTDCFITTENLGNKKIFLLTEAYHYFINPFFVNPSQASVSFLYPGKH